jgi:hypothetical protein
MKASQLHENPLVCRSSLNRKLFSAGLIASLVAVLSVIPAHAGTSTDAEITDVAGDGNFINGQGAQSGHEVGPDTRPASFDNVDLRAVWFETAYNTVKVVSASGDVQRVEYRPKALVIHVQTQGSAQSMSPFGTINYRVSATLPGCQASFELDVFSSAAPDRAVVRSLEGTECGTSATSPVAPTFEGNVSTMTFPLANSLVAPFISAGTAIGQPSAYAWAILPSAPGRRADETVVGRSFTIGQDVPPDIDCSADPTNSECDS